MPQSTAARCSAFAKLSPFPLSSTHSALAPGVRPIEVWAWAMFDFANSGYTTVVITAIFNAYFVSVVAGNATWATLAWTGTLAVSYALMMLTGPLIGAYADVHASKKRLLAGDYHRLRARHRRRLLRWVAVTWLSRSS